MLRILLTAAAGAVVSGVLGLILLPVLRALKAGQSVHKIGPTWHNNKVGTPLMGGLMFIGAVIVCLVGNLFTMEDYTVFFVLALAFCFGIVGFLDDFFKVKFKRDLGLRAFQKMALQMVVCVGPLTVVILALILRCRQGRRSTLTISAASVCGIWKYILKRLSKLNIYRCCRRSIHSPR